MAGDRKAFEKIVLDFMSKVTKGGHNAKIYKDLFGRCNDEQIEQIVVNIEKGGCLPVWASNWDSSEMLDFRNIQKLAKQYDVALETQLVIFDQDTGLEVITPETYYVGTAEVRRQRQMLAKKFGYAKDDLKIDDLTGQVMGDSRGTGISNPEIQVLLYLGLPTLAKELYDVRGGDLKALDVYRKELMDTGRTNTNEALRRGSGIKSLSTAHFLFRGRGLDNNLNQR